MVDLHLHPSLLALVGILDLGVEHAQDAALHGVWRDEELVEAEWREWAVDEIEYLSHLVHQFRTGGHHQIVGIDFGIALVEVSGSHAGDVALLRLDIEQFGVNLQSFNTEDHVYALFLHTLAPLDVALLVEACQKLYHGSHLLAVAGSGDECLDYL